jgi:hypothetical protein
MAPVGRFFDKAARLWWLGSGFALDLAFSAHIMIGICNLDDPKWHTPWPLGYLLRFDGLTVDAARIAATALFFSSVLYLRNTVILLIFFVMQFVKVGVIAVGVSFLIFLLQFLTGDGNTAIGRAIYSLMTVATAGGVATLCFTSINKIDEWAQEAMEKASPVPAAAMTIPAPPPPPRDNRMY